MPQQSQQGGGVSTELSESIILLPRGFMGPSSCGVNPVRILLWYIRLTCYRVPHPSICLPFFVLSKSFLVSTWHTEIRHFSQPPLLVVVPCAEISGKVVGAWRRTPYPREKRDIYAQC